MRAQMTKGAKSFVESKGGTLGIKKIYKENEPKEIKW